MIRLSDILRVMAYEYRSILHSLPVVLVLGGGIFLYGFLYNYMYSPNVLREVPVTVIDESATALSRHYIRLLDATPQVHVVTSSVDMLEARNQMRCREVEGIVYLPSSFDARMGRGEESVFVTYNTTLTFLYYAALQEALTGAMLALNDEIRPNQLVFLSSDDLQTIVETRTMGVQGIALYNPLGGYADYLIPAVLMVILFQTLLMVISMRCGMECEQRNCSLYPFVDNRLWGRGAVSVVIGKALVYVSIYAVFSVFLLGFLPMLFGLPHLADAWVLVQLLVPYLFATAFFGLACSPFFKDSDAPLLLIAFFSVGLLFLSGISYPLELMPWPWRILHCLIPAPVGVLAFVKANSMGASLDDIQGEWLLLWLQCVVYFCLACMAYRKTLSSFYTKV